MDFNFLVSSERSGSNLVTKIMDAHPDICGPSPKHLIRVMGLDHYRYGDLSRAQVWNRLLEDVNLILEADYSVWRAEFDLDRLRSLAPVGCLDQLIRGIYTLEAAANSKASVFIKELHVLSYFPFLNWCFPQSKFLFLVRDPRDVCISWRNNPAHHGGLVNAALQWKADQLASIKDYLPLMKAGRAMVIRYENLLSDPQKELQKVCRLLQKPFHPDMLSFHKNDLTVENSKKQPAWENLGKELMTDNFAKYRTELSGAEIAVIERVVTPGVMQAFGYKPESTSKAREDQSQAVIAKLRESEASQFPRETNSSRVMMHDLVQQRLRGA